MWPIEAERANAVVALQAFASLDWDARERERWRRFLDEARAYEGYLLDLPDEELLVQATAIEEAKLNAPSHDHDGAELDMWAPYTRPGANANFSHWLSLAIWSQEEATALAIGKEPSFLHPDKLQMPSRSGSPFIRRYKALRERILRAVKAGDIEEPIRPKAFIEWAEQNGIELPKQLHGAPGVESAAFWKARCEEAESERDSVRSQLKAVEAELKTLRDDVAYNPGAKRKTTLNKMVVGMAIARFEHLIQGPSGAKLISGELEDLGFYLKYDAVHKVLNEAADALGCHQNPRMSRVKITKPLTRIID